MWVRSVDKETIIDARVFSILHLGAKWYVLAYTGSIKDITESLTLGGYSSKYWAKEAIDCLYSAIEMGENIMEMPTEELLKEFEDEGETDREAMAEKERIMDKYAKDSTEKWKDDLDKHITRSDY